MTLLLPQCAGPNLRGLFALFPPGEYLAHSHLVPADEVPEPYHRLLVHEHHMTVTVEAHHKDLVDVQVLERHASPDTYARKIVLPLQQSRRIVLFGLACIHLNYCTEEVRREILSERTPLGRILINHNVLCRIEPTAFLRITPGPALAHWFGLNQPRPTYGRLALIHCDGRPAIELLEIVAPE